MPTYSELPYDILHQLCALIGQVNFDTLKVFSQVDKRTRSAAVSTLFRAIGFRQQWGENITPSWEDVQEISDALLSNKEALAAIRQIHLGPWVCVPKPFPAPNGLFNIIHSCNNLKDLRLALEPEYIKQTRDSLMGSSAREKQVVNDLASQPVFLLESLTVPSPAWLKLSPLFPNLRSLKVINMENWFYKPVAVLDYKSLAKAHPRLTKLHTPDQGISVVVEEIFKYFPDIEDLGLFGSMSSCILDHLPSYTRLTKLAALTLADESFLGLGIHLTSCGNPIRYGETLESVQKEREEALARLTDGVERILIQGRGTCALKQLNIGPTSGGYNFVYVKDEDGKLKKVMR